MKFPPVWIQFAAADLYRETNASTYRNYFISIDFFLKRTDWPPSEYLSRHRMNKLLPGGEAVHICIIRQQNPSELFVKIPRCDVRKTASAISSSKFSQATFSSVAIASSASSCTTTITHRKTHYRGARIVTVRGHFPNQTQLLIHRPARFYSLARYWG